MLPGSFTVENASSHVSLSCIYFLSATDPLERQQAVVKDRCVIKKNKAKKELVK